MCSISYVLLRIPGQQRQVEDECNPVSVDQEQDCEECVDTGFGDDVGVQAVAEVNRVDVIAIIMLARHSDRDCETRDLSRRDASRVGKPSTASSGQLGRMIGMTVPFQIAVHDSEEDLEEKIDRVDQDCYKI